MSKPPKAGDTIALELEVTDLVSVGFSLRALARNQKTPPGTREIYDRVGGAMVNAYHNALRGGAK